MRSLLAATAVIAAATACGSGGAASEKRAFVAASDQICRSVAHKTLPALREIFPTPNGLPNVEAAVRTGPAFVRAYRSALQSRRSLRVPRIDRARLEHHYLAYEQALDDLKRLNDQTSMTESPATYAGNLKPVSEEFYALNRFEKDYGFKVCGSEPDQSGDTSATGSGS